MTLIRLGTKAGISLCDLLNMPDLVYSMLFSINIQNEFLNISSVDAIAIRNRRDDLAKKMLEKLKTK
jgi:hypothetical protein